MPIYLLESHDGGGKTTLANYFKEKHGAVIYHQIYRWPKLMFHYHTAALRLAIKRSLQGRLVILDRHWISEAIYGRVYRGLSTVPLEGRFMDRVLLKHCALHILCVGGRQRAEEVSNARGEQNLVEAGSNSGDRSRFPKLLEAYTNMVYGKPGTDKAVDYAHTLELNGGFKRFDTVAYDYEDDGKDLDEFQALCSALHQSLEASQYPPALTSDQNVLGHPFQAEYLFVGDVCNQKHHNMWWPFFEYGNSSLFLTQALHNLNFREECAMWVNINHPGGDLQVTKLLDYLLKNVKVIAFGNAASATLNSINIPHTKIEHPASAKRFSTIDNYTLQLAHALTR